MVIVSGVTNMYNRVRICITVTSYERRGVSRHRHRNCFSTFCSDQQQRSNQAPHYYPLWRWGRKSPRQRTHYEKKVHTSWCHHVVRCTNLWYIAFYEICKRVSCNFGCYIMSPEYIHLVYSPIFYRINWQSNSHWSVPVCQLWHITECSVGWLNVGPTSELSSRRLPNLKPTFIAVWDGYTQPKPNDKRSQQNRKLVRNSWEALLIIICSDDQGGQRSIMFKNVYCL